MLHELKDIIRSAKISKEKGVKSVLASVVFLEGSSYRRPGVRMLIQEDGKMIGAVSGGCVEKEILRQSKSVFENNQSKLMKYDGRFRLGCEGILYILIEPVDPEKSFFEAFEKQNKSRNPFTIESFYSKDVENTNNGGSIFYLDKKKFTINNQKTENLEMYRQEIKPGFQLIIVGSEHDSVELCKFASNIGWQVTIVAPPDDPKKTENFPGANEFLGIDEKDFSNLNFDDQTAIVFMTHSYVKDLKYLSTILQVSVPYIGLLGPSNRKEKIIHDLLELNNMVSDDFFNRLYGPAGINIGAETPQEIAISIVSEILTVIRKQKPISLRDKKTGIHQ